MTAPDNPGRRLHLRRYAALVPALALPLWELASGSEPPQVIRLTAQRFHFTPETVEVKAGQALMLELTALDFAHGFNLPDLKLRIDLSPEHVTRLAVQFDKPGDYAFICDNFCGDSHEDMGGKFVVLA
jgi:cytochrome c oxidase subunit II